MSRKEKGWLIGGAITCILSALIVLVVVYGVECKDKVLSWFGLYTQEEYNSFGEEKYAAGVKDREKIIVELRDAQGQILLLEENVKESNAEKDSLKSSLQSLQNEKAVVENNLKTASDRISQLEKDSENHEAELEEIKQQKSSLEEDKQRLETQIEQKNQEIQNKDSSITEMQSQITNFQNRIKELSAELEAYKDMELTGVYKCTFMNEDKIEAVYYVDEGENIKYIPTIEQTHDTWFYGFSTERGSQDPNLTTEYIPTEDTTFYAVKGPCITVNLNGELYRYGENLKVKELLSFDTKIDLEDPNYTLNLECCYGFPPEQEIQFQTLTLDTILKDIAKTIIMSPSNSEDGKTWAYATEGIWIKYSLTYKFEFAEKVQGIGANGLGRGELTALANFNNVYMRNPHNIKFNLISFEKDNEIIDGEEIDFSNVKTTPELHDPYIYYIYNYVKDETTITIELVKDNFSNAGFGFALRNPNNYDITVTFEYSCEFDVHESQIYELKAENLNWDLIEDKTKVNPNSLKPIE